MKGTIAKKLLRILMITTLLTGVMFCHMEVHATTTQTKTAVDSGVIPCVNDTDNVTWTLYDDGELVFSGNGTTDIIGKKWSTRWASYWSGELDKEDVNSVCVATGSRISLDTCHNMFYRFTNCKTIDMTGFDTSKVADMSDMFYGCESLATLELGDFDTSNVTDMSSMFIYCKALGELDVSGFDTGKVTDMSNMFASCEKIAELDVTGFDTGNATNLSHMFAYCEKVAELDVSGFVTDKVTNMSYMFAGCEKVTALDVTDFKTDNVTDMSAMFFACYALEKLDVKGFVTDKVTNMGSMFNGCNALSSLDVTRFNTGNVTNMFAMFAHCRLLKSLDVTGFNTEKVTNMKNMFTGCYLITSLDVSNFVTTSVTDMSYMFSECRKLSKLDVSKFNTSNVTSMSYMFYTCEALVNLDVSQFDTSNVTDMCYMFGYCDVLETINLTGFNTSKVTDMSRMFRGCEKLKNVNIAELETENVEDMKYMFSHCDGFTSLDLSTFKTSKVTDMSGMFQFSDNLTTVNLSSFDTGVVEKMDEMFYYCSSLTTLDVTGFVTDNVTSMAAMFCECESLQSIDVSEFNTEKVKNMSNMFYGCEALTSLDVSNFDTSKVQAFDYFAEGCTGLDVLDLSSFDTSAAISALKIRDSKVLITPATNTEKNTTTFTFENLWEEYIWYDDEGNKYYGDESTNVEIGPATRLTRVNRYNEVYYIYGGKKRYLTEYEMETGLNKIPTLDEEDLDDLGLKGYTFIGWYEDENLTRPVTSFAANVPGERVIYPKIVGNKYTITYENVKQASNKDELPAEYCYGESLTLPQLESTCYTFVGWYLDEDMTKAISTITDTTDGDLTLYARWIQDPTHEIVESNKKDATCTELGYTGDYYCNTCQKMVIIGENLPKIPHDDSVVKNVVKETCTTDGYTGDKHCKHCDVLVKKGEVIAKTGHDVDMTKGTVVTPATATTEGEMEYQCKNCDYTVKEPIEKTGSDFVKEQGIPEDTVAITDATITALTDDNDIKGSSFVAIQASANKTTKNSISLKWNKVKNADGYKIYGNKCGKKNRYKYIKTISNGKTTKFTQKKLKKGTYYKYIVRAYKLIDGQEVTIAASKTIHATTTGGKYGNAKSVKIKTDKKMKSKKGSYTLTIKKNKKYTIKASEVKQSKKIKKHRVIKFESSDASVATVNSKGSVKGIKKGTCYIYAYAQNGTYKKIKVKVK